MPPNTRSIRSKANPQSTTTQTNHHNFSSALSPRSTLSRRRSSLSPAKQLTEATSSVSPSPGATDFDDFDDFATSDTTLTPSPPTGDSDDNMLHTAVHDRTGLRGRNIEDTGELEEKGLLRHAEGDMSSLTREDKGNKEVRMEKVDYGYEEGAEGLNNPRDRNAFALLVLLCMSSTSVNTPIRMLTNHRPVRLPSFPSVSTFSYLPAFKVSHLV